MSKKKKIAIILEITDIESWTVNWRDDEDVDSALEELKSDIPYHLTALGVDRNDVKVVSVVVLDK